MKMKDVSATVILFTCFWAYGVSEHECHFCYNRTVSCTSGHSSSMKMKDVSAIVILFTYVPGTSRDRNLIEHEGRLSYNHTC